MRLVRFAVSLVTAVLGSSLLAYPQVPDAGPDQTVVFPTTVTLAGSILGGSPLDWWTADGNGSFENFLMKYDDASGVTPVGPLRTASGGTFGDPTGLLRVGSTIYGIDALRRMLYTLDPSTGIVTPIGSTAWPTTYSDVESLAYDPTGDRLFAEDRPTGQLLLIDRSTGSPRPVGTATLAGFLGIRSLAWRSSTGLLYAVDNVSLAILSIDPSTGMPSVLSNLAHDNSGRIEDLEFVGDRLYGVRAIQSNGIPIAAQLQRISPGFGLVQNIGPAIDQTSPMCMMINSLPEDCVWSKVSGPGSVGFSNPYALNPTVVFSQPGTYVLKLTVISASGPVSDTVTIVESGWTTFSPSNDTRVVYVSSSTGNDSNDGLSPASARRTIAGGKALLRNGFPDWLLLKCGDNWIENLNTNGEFRLNGRSTTEKMLVSSYGTGPRPRLRTGISNGVDSFTQGNHVAIVGIHFWADTYNGSQGTIRGVQWLGGSTDFLLEDCYVQGYESNVVVMGVGNYRQTNTWIRRNVIVDAYNTLGTNSQGLYAEGVDGLVIDENVLDHNGWRDDVAGSYPTWYRRNVYIQNGCTGVVFRGNILSGTDGLQLRPGGVCEDNLFLRNAISLQFGSGNTPELSGVSGTIRNNVILDGGDLQSGSPRGWGLILGNTVNTPVDHNVVAHNVTGSSPNPWVLNFDNGHGNPAGLQNVLFDHNVVYDWGSIGRGAQIASYQSNTMLNITFRSNDIQDNVDATYLMVLNSSTPNLAAQIHSSNNRWYRWASGGSPLFQLAGANLSFQALMSALGDSTSVYTLVNSYPDPNRTIATYNASLGGGASLDAFMTQAGGQSRANWRPEYTAFSVNAYVRAGFGL